MHDDSYHRILRIGSLILAVILTCCASEANASEYGISTYRPGIMDLFSGYLADSGTSIVKDYFMFQETSGDATTPNGALTAKSRTTSYTNATFVSHTSDYGLLGAYWAYGGLVQERISDQSLRFGPTAHLGAAQNETIGGLGDLELLPEMLAWKLGKFHLMEGLAVYVPTGSYDSHRIINIGNNRWAIEPDIGVTWMDPDTGRHFSLFTGYTVNAENTATHYHSGQEFHADFVAAQHLPMGYILGAAGYALQQTTADTGSGAIFGPYEGRVLGLAPLVGKAFQIGSIPLTVTVKYVFEFAAANRCVGNELWLTAGIRF